MSSSYVYSLVKNQPVARFFYRGKHTHPVRRTVLIVENNGKTFTGYELREGSIVRNTLDKAPIKSFRKDRIATIGQIDRRRKLRKDTPSSRQDQTTFNRSGLTSLVTEGI
jgi:hypothetical protein